MPLRTTVRIEIYQRAGSWRYAISIDDGRVIYGDLGVDDGASDEAAVAAARAMIRTDEPDRMTIMRIADVPAGDRKGPKRRAEAPLDRGMRGGER